MFMLSRTRRPLDIWPGFVDALAALLMVVIFVLLIFTMSHFFLSDALTGRDRALEQLNLQIAELSDLLSMEKSRKEDFEKELGTLRVTLAGLETERDELNATVVAAQSRRDELESLLADGRAQRQDDLTRFNAALETAQTETLAQEELTTQAQAQVALLNQQIAALREQLTRISDALALSDAVRSEQETQIADLGRRLNLALAERVQELARYRSEFFGRLREVLGDNPNIRIEGDRFVFQSELLFDSGSAELRPDGLRQVRQLVNTLNEVAPRIPDDLNWVLRIDGHTDRRPIATALFPSNWELSVARALSIVRYMIALGVPPGNLMAAGFGEFHPLDSADTPQAWQQNRRIEIKLTQR
jgi:chemotaxis protein MotB